MQCPACSKKIDFKSISNKKTINFVFRFCCPNCEKWISFQPSTEYLKIVGFLGLFIGSIAGLMVSDTDIRIAFSAVGFAGAILALVASKRNKLQVIEN